MNLMELAADIQRRHHDCTSAASHGVTDTEGLGGLIEIALQLARRVIDGSPPVLAALLEVRADLAELDVIDDEDGITAADLREHDEHNFDVREDIEESAQALAAALDTWMRGTGPGQ